MMRFGSIFQLATAASEGPRWACPSSQRRSPADPYPSHPAEVEGEYGWPRTHKELLARGIRAGKGRVRKLTQQHGIRAKTEREFVVSTDSRHSLPLAPDLVRRRFNPEGPQQLVSADINYIATDEGWRYLAAAIDLFSPHVVGWSLQPYTQTGLIKNALAMAWWCRHPSPGLMVHQRPWQSLLQP
ncbi:HTH-like domain protein [Tepidimonas charontis]|uniref:HTH-like domain protein n=1 Tax=Tepidimonas charontis TaxID=2267262 RepID=A0A554WZ01_9BURK|nr:HTH-like domain protein [Tepidimonas charontis]